MARSPPSLLLCCILVALEVKQLVAHLLAAGSPADSILPKAARKQRLALELLLGTVYHYYY